MREIKFRLWDKEGQRMVYQPTIGQGSNASVISIGLDGHITMHNMFGLPDGKDTQKFYDDRFIKMQFTGLKDKNGKEIFEGDLIKHAGGESSVIFADQEWKMDFGRMGFGRDTEPLNMYSSFEMEIVGNIHDKIDQ